MFDKVLIANRGAIAVRIHGIKTSLPLHLRILNEPDFEAGSVTTSFMERYATKPDVYPLAESA
jgi:biotin carboxylase